MTQNESNEQINSEPPNYAHSVASASYPPAPQVPIFLPAPNGQGPSTIHYTIRPIDYQNAMQQQSLAYRHYLLDKKMRETFPLGYIIFHSLFMMLLSMALIALQVFLLIEDANGSYVGGGFWCGAWVIFISIFTLSSIGCKNMCTVVTTVVFHLINIFFVFSGCVIMPIVTVTSSSPCNFDYYPDTCDAITIWQLSYSMLAIACLTILLSLIFSILILVRVVNKNKEFNRQLSYTQHFGAANPIYSTNNQQVQFAQTC